MDVGEIFGTVVGVLVIIYVAFVLITQFSKMDPNFAPYGWGIFLALIAGVVLFFKYGLFK